MTDIAAGIKDLLVTAGVGTFAASSGWGIFIGSEPGEPTTTITIFETGGEAANPKFLLDFPTANIRVRGDKNGYTAGRAKIQEVKDALLGLPSQDLNGDRWVSITMISDIHSLGRSERNEPMWGLKLSLIIEPATGTHRESLC